MIENKKSFGALKMMYWRHKNYQYRGRINRLKKALSTIIRRHGYDAWLDAVHGLNNSK